MIDKIIKYIKIDDTPHYAIMEGRHLCPPVVSNLKGWKDYREEVHLQQMKKFYSEMSEEEFEARFPNETVEDVIERQKWNIIFEDYYKNKL